jgi:hypothetical protein
MGGRPTSGFVQMPVVGIVVDNVDEEGLGRVKVKFPTLPGEPQSFWLRQITPNGGAVGGMYALPEKEDEVLVMFLQGNQDNGVIIGQFWNGTTKPPTESADGMPGSGKTDTGGNWSKDKLTDGSGDIQANDRRFWRSRAGHLMVFDDTEGKETVQIWDGSHTMCIALDMAESRMFLTNKTGDIHLRTKQDIYFEAGRDIFVRAGRNIEGESVDDTKHKAGKLIDIESGEDTKLKVGADLKIDVAANIKMEAGVNIDIKGVMIKTNASNTNQVLGSSMVVVRGGRVKIN